MAKNSCHFVWFLSCPNHSAAVGHGKEHIWHWIGVGIGFQSARYPGSNPGGATLSTSFASDFTLDTFRPEVCPKINIF